MDDITSDFSGMRERIRTLMVSRHMTQQDFASFLGLSPATLSSIFNGRTRPTLMTVSQLKEHFPELNTDWLLFGRGEMFLVVGDDEGTTTPLAADDLFIDVPPTPAPAITAPSPAPAAPTAAPIAAAPTPKPRRVVEIRVYYDDSTYEAFNPAL